MSSTRKDALKLNWCLISIFVENFSSYEHVLATLLKNNKQQWTCLDPGKISWIFCITTEHKSSCKTKIFYYKCKILFIIFLLKSFMVSVWNFF